MLSWRFEHLSWFENWFHVWSSVVWGTECFTSPSTDFDHPRRRLSLVSPSLNRSPKQFPNPVYSAVS
jgi:hypothetical protein